MCGLLAFVAAAASAEAAGPPAALSVNAAEAVARASHLMHHRGPDELGIWTDPSDSQTQNCPVQTSSKTSSTAGANTAGANTKSSGTVLGFNRLSIIDIAHSHQPLRWGPPEHPDRYVLVFNGEIYNYVELRAELGAAHGAIFATEGDGEAIVAAYHYWGTDALTRLRGMFAFALWDTLSGELFCARDPFGIKPLFLAAGRGGIAVASEKKCLLDLAELVGFDTEIDHRALQHYTVLQYVPEPETLHRGVRKLESG